MMAAGANAGFAGINLPFLEAVVSASVFMLGGLVMAAVRLPLVTTVLAIRGFAILHGCATLSKPLPAILAATSWVFWLRPPCSMPSAWGSACGTQGGAVDLGLRAMGGLVLTAGT